MNKKPLKTGNQDFDDFGTDNSFGNEYGNGQDDKSNKPAAPVRKAIKESLKKEFTDEATYRAMVGKALPREYGDVFDSYTAVKGGINELVDQVKDDLRGPTNDVAKLLKSKLPSSMKRMHKTVDSIIERTTSYKYARNIDKERDNITALEMERVFSSTISALDQASAAREAEASAIQNERDVLELKHRQSEMQVLNSIARHTAIQSQAATGYQLAATKKSMQLQFKQTFLLTDILRTMTEQSKMQEALLKNIQKNTGLSEIDKTKMSTSIKGAIRDKFNNTMLGNDRNAVGFINQVTKNSKESLKGITGGLGSAISQLVGMAEAPDLYDYDNMTTSQMMAHKAVTNLFSQFGKDGLSALAKKGVGVAGKKYGKLNTTISRGADKLGYINSALPGIMAGLLEEKETDGSMKAGAIEAFKQVLASVTQQNKTDLKLGMEGLRDLTSPTSFDVMTRRSISETIPGYLARILQELQTTRTGKAAPLQTFDYKKGSFVTAGAMKNSINQELKGSLGARSAMNDFVAQLRESNPNLSDVDAKALQKEVMRGDLRGESANVETFMKEDFWKNLPEDQKKRILATMRGHFGSKDGKYTSTADNDKRRNRMFGSYNEAQLATRFGDVRGTLQNFINAGQGDALREMGIINGDNEIDEDKFVDLMLGYSGSGLDNKKEYEEKLKEWKKRQKAREYNARSTGVGSKLSSVSKALFGDDEDDPMPTLKDFKGSGVDYTEGEQGTEGAARRRRRGGSSGIAGQGNRRVRETNISNTTIEKNTSLTLPSDFTSAVYDIRDILKTGFSDLVNKGIKSTVQTDPDSTKLDPLPVFSVPGGDTLDSIKGMFSEANVQKVKDAISENETVKSLRERIGDTTLDELKEKGQDLLLRGKDLAADAGVLAAKKGREGIDKLLMARLRAKAKIRSLSAFGAGKMDDLGKELPDFADLYIEGSMVARIIGAKIKNGDYRTADGTILHNLKEIAKHAGDIYDENGQIVLSVGEKATAYTAANFETFAQKFHEYALQGLNAAQRGISNLFNFGSTQVGKVVNFAKSTVGAFAKELLVPPEDVYVVGEGFEKPRLYAWKMREGRYTSQHSGKLIEWPAQITGPVMEKVGESYEIALTEEDLNKGICNNKGEKFVSLKLRTVKAAKDFLAGTKNLLGSLANKGKDLGVAGVKGVGAGIRGAGVFATSGLNGVLYGPDGVAYNASGVGGDGLSVLEQIRDILDARLPGKGKFKSGGRKGRRGGSETTSVESGTSSDSSDDPVAFTGQATAEQKPISGVKGLRAEPGQANNSLGQLVGLGGAIGSGVMKVGSAIGNVFKRRRGVSTSLGEGVAGGNGTQADAGGEKTGIFNKLAKLLGPAAGGGLAANIAQSKAGAKQATNVSSGGEEPMLNRTQDRLNKMTNKNADSIKSGDEFEGPEHFNNENVIDQIINAVSGVTSGAGGMLSDAADLLDGGGDDDRRRRRRSRKSVRDRAKRMKAGAKARAAAKKPGMFGRLTGWGAGKVGKAADYVGGKIAGAPGRAAAYKSFFSKAAGLAGSIAGKRGLLTLGGAALAAVIGAPAVAVGLGLYTAWEVGSGVFKWLKDDKPENSLTLLRFYEYGFGKGSHAQQEVVAKLEQMCLKALIESGDEVRFDPKKMDLEAIMKLFGVNEKDENRLNEMLKWIERRFKPVLAKWHNAMKAVKSNFEKVNDLDLELKKQVLNYTIANKDGWDVLNNPFSISTPLEITSNEILTAYDNVQKFLDAEIDKAPKKNGVDADKAFFGGTTKVAGKRNKPNQAKESSPGEASQENGWKLPGAEKSNKWDTTGGASVAITTLAIPAIPTNTLTALGAIRMYAYGLTVINRDKLRALSLLESELIPYIKMDKDGKANVTVDLEKSWAKIGKHFGIAGDNAKDLEQFKLWFSKRFMPVFTTFYSQLLFYTGAKDLDTALNTVKPAAAMAVATAVRGLPVWGETASPWGEDYPLGTMSAICTDSFKVLEGRAAQEKIEVEKPSTAPPQQGAKSPTNAPEKPKPTTSGMQKTSFTTGATADAEPEPSKGSGAGNSNQDAKVPSVGAVKQATGELHNGSGAMQYLKFHKGAKLEGANPEMLRLFNGMVEEYGALTGKSVQVNDGFRSYQEQLALHQKNPAKAAKPGSSMHEFGLAIDINSDTANELEKLGLMKKYGFTRPVGGEPWHIEPAGLQQAIQYFKKNKEEASQAINASIGRGGGGVGMTRTGYAVGRRSQDAAKKWFEASGEMVSDKPKGGYAGSVDAAKISDISPEAQRAGFTNDAAMRPMVSAANDPSITSTPSQSKPNVGDGGGYQNAAMPDSEGDPSKLKGLPTSDMKQLVHQTAEAVGVDPSIAKMTVAVESNFKANAAAGTSSATGLYQFTSGTWKDMVRKHGAKYGITNETSRNDPKANAILGALYLKENLKRAKSLGVPQTAVGAYTMHFLGPGGASSFWRMSDDAIVANTMRDAARANKNIFFNKDGTPRTKAQIVQLLQEKLNRAAKSNGIEPSGSVDAAPTSALSKDSGMLEAVYKPEKANVSGDTIQAKYIPTQEPKTLSDYDAPAPQSNFSAMQPMVAKNEAAAVREHTSGENGQGNYEKIAREALDVNNQQLKSLQNIEEILSNILAAVGKGESVPEANSLAQAQKNAAPPRRSVLQARTA